MQKKRIISYIILFLSFLIIFLTFYLRKNFYGATFEQLFFSLYTSGGASMNAMYEGALFVFCGAILSIVIIKIVVFILKKYSITVYDFLNEKNIVLSIICLVLAIIFIFWKLGGITYFINQISKSNFIEENYVDPRNVMITCPEKKQNLIYIFVESLETTDISKENGGAMEVSYIPKLEQLAMDNISFSNSNKLGGALSIHGTTWTVSAMIGQTSGLPLKISIGNKTYFGFNSNLLGIYSLGELLEDNGYKNYLMMGSISEFGKRKEYFEEHGNYEIYDYNYAKEEGLIPNDYNVWWGFEDKKLYDFSKEKLLEISQSEEPFNYTILTADTHFIDGYVDSSCDKAFEGNYENSFYCADQMLLSFINWIKEQDFYENTTIVVVGDHLTMQENFYDDINSNYQRTIYNAFINSKTITTNTINRSFTTLDYYPTTIASLGCTIEGNRLGLGTNLFSNEKTIIEKNSWNKVNNELSKRSLFYDKYILK